MNTIETNQNKANEHVQNLLNKWKPLEDAATVEQKNRIGLSYISNVLGLGEEVAEKFVNGDYEAWLQVGDKQSAIPVNADVETFWHEADEVFHNFHSKEEIDFLINDGGIYGVLEFIYNLDGMNRPVSREIGKAKVSGIPDFSHATHDKQLGTSVTLRKIIKNALSFK